MQDTYTKAELVEKFKELEKREIVRAKRDMELGESAAAEWHLNRASLLKELIALTEAGGTLMIYYCARCGKPIPRGKEMMEKIGGRLVPTHMDCRERYSKKTLDQMIHEALDKGPGNEIRRKMRGRND